MDSFLHKDSQQTDVEEEASKKVVEALHKILRPFLLRRVKSDVEKSLLPSMLIFLNGELTLNMFYREGDQYLRGADRDAKEMVSFNT